MLSPEPYKDGFIGSCAAQISTNKPNYNSLDEQQKLKYNSLSM